MKTIKELKALIGYTQTDEVFLNYLPELVKAGVITLDDGDIDADAGTVSDDFFERLAAVYGVQLDEELRRIPDDMLYTGQSEGN